MNQRSHRVELQKQVRPAAGCRRRRGTATTAMVLTISVLLTIVVGLIEFHRAMAELSAPRYATGANGDGPARVERGLDAEVTNS